MQDLKPGHRVGSFLCERQIGLGSFASVWKGHHIISHSPVAIKVIGKASIDNAVARTRLQREIALLKQLNHPFIAELFQVTEDADNYLLIMEYVEHGNLMDYVNDHGELSEDQARRYFLQLVSVLEYLHVDKRIAHRDLKCENVLLDRHNNIRLIDFGLSNMFSEAAPSLQTACGSPAYAAPEMVLGSGYTQAADIWSAGIVLFAIMAGYLPFDDDQIQHILHKIVYSEIEFPETFSPQLVDLLKRMLCKDPRGRITAHMITQHPWFSQSDYAAMVAESRFAAPSEGDEEAVAVDPDIIQEMTAFGIDCHELPAALLIGEFTDLTALYRIFRRERLVEANKDLFQRVSGGASTARPGGLRSILSNLPKEVEPKKTVLAAVRLTRSVKSATPPPPSDVRPLPPVAQGSAGGRSLSRPAIIRKPRIMSPSPISSPRELN
jgi:tRNA A-37 threonylcarbamoyl transferase component Bud32